MDVLKPETLVLFLVFVVPGFVAMRVHDLLVPGPRRELGGSLLEAVTYSMLNLAVMFWAVEPLIRPGIADRHPWFFRGGVGFVLFVAPALLAVVAYRLQRSRWLGRYVQHPAPTAWDFFFGQRRSCWVLAHFRGGQMLGGLVDQGSSASGFPQPQDLYFEQVWRVDGQGKFQEPIEQTAGALVRMDECTHLEFFEYRR